MVTTQPAAAPATPSSTGRTTPSASSTPARPRLYALDALRFLAAAGVMLYHFTASWHTGWGTEQPGERFPVLGNVSIYFALAPELFFVVSGFVILWTAWGRSVPTVVASRLSRVYPTYWAALALTSFLLLVMWPAGKDVTIVDALVNTTLMQEAFGVRHVDGVYWTLWAELRFYLLITLFVAWGITRRRVVGFAVLWPLAALGADVLQWDCLQTLLISRYAPFFAAGMLLYLIHRDGHTRLLWALVGANTVVAVHNTAGPMTATLRRATVFEPNQVLIAVLAAGCIATVAIVSMTPVSRIRGEWLTVLGGMTYPLYLIHQFWGWWAIDRLDPHLPTYTVLAVAMILAVSMAAAIHFAVERRFSPPARRGIERLLTRGRVHRAPAEEVRRRPAPTRRPTSGHGPATRPAPAYR